MTVLIDTPVWHWRGRLWSHLVSDVSYEELHAFVAAELGIPRRAFQGDHYDVPEELYQRAVDLRIKSAGAFTGCAASPVMGRSCGACLRRSRCWSTSPSGWTARPSSGRS